MHITIKALLIGCAAILLTSCAHQPEPNPYIPEETSVVDKQFNFHIVAPGFWRSSQPNHESIVRMKKHGLKTLINFRGDEATNVWEMTLCDSLGITYYNFPIDGREKQDRQQWQEILDIVANPDNQPVLVHCLCGKDRTGFGAALILDVLGVSEEAIVDDYLLTNNYLPLEKEIERLSSEFSDHEGASVSEEVLRPMLEVRPEYIRACFDEIKKRYKSKQHFYESALNLDSDKVAHLKGRFLD